MILIPDARVQLGVGKPVNAVLVTRDRGNIDLELQHTLTEDDVRIILAGGMLNC